LTVITFPARKQTFSFFLFSPCECPTQELLDLPWTQRERIYSVLLGLVVPVAAVTFGSVAQQRAQQAADRGNSDPAATALQENALRGVVAKLVLKHARVLATPDSPCPVVAYTDIVDDTNRVDNLALLEFFVDVLRKRCGPDGLAVLATPSSSRPSLTVVPPAVASPAAVLATSKVLPAIGTAAPVVEAAAPVVVVATAMPPAPVDLAGDLSAPGGSYSAHPPPSTADASPPPAKPKLVQRRASTGMASAHLFSTLNAPSTSQSPHPAGVSGPVSVTTPVQGGRVTPTAGRTTPLPPADTGPRRSATPRLDDPTPPPQLIRVVGKRRSVRHCVVGF
jgi:hypothetical protein